MPTIARAALPPAELPSEEVEVTPLGGSVLVRGLTMPEFLRWSAQRRALLEPRAGESAEDAQQRASAEMVPLILSMAVVLDDGDPVYTAAQWSAFGARHPEEATVLFQAAVRLSGQDPQAEKKT